MIQIKMQHKKGTKNTEVYESHTPNASIPTLYIAKTAFKGEAPKFIEVSFKAVEE